MSEDPTERHYEAFDKAIATLSAAFQPGPKATCWPRQKA